MKDTGLLKQINELGVCYGFLARIASDEFTLAPLMVGFGRRLKLQFHGAKFSSSRGLLSIRKLDDARGSMRDGVMGITR